MTYRYSYDLQKKLCRVTLIYTLIFVVIFVFAVFTHLQSEGEESDTGDCWVMLLEVFLIFLLGCIFPLRYADVRSQKYRLDSECLSIYRHGKEKNYINLAKVKCIMICRQELPLLEGSHGGGNLISDEELSIVLFESDNVDFILRRIHEAYPKHVYGRFLAYTNRAFENLLSWPLLYTCYMEKKRWRSFLFNYNKTVVVPKSLYDANVCGIRELLGPESKILIDELF